MSDISREAVESLLPYQLLSYKAMNCDVVKMQDTLRALRDALDESEAANRALQAEVDRLNRAIARKDSALSTSLEALPAAAINIRHKVFNAIAYTGHEPQQGEQT